MKYVSDRLTEPLIYVMCRVRAKHETSIAALFDSGAAISSIDPRLVRSLGLWETIRTDINYEVVDAFTGKPRKPYGEVRIPFSIGEQKFSQVFTITDLTDAEHIILGNPFWLSQSFRLAYDNGRAALHLNKKRIRVVTEPSRAGEEGVVRLRPLAHLEKLPD